MAKTFQITLDAADLGQTLDGLRAREEAWSKTADYLRAGDDASDFFIVEECHDSAEAERIAQHYRSIIEQIERQIVEQGGW